MFSGPCAPSVSQKTRMSTPFPSAEECVRELGRPSGICVVASLSPLRGLLNSHWATHGLRRGLHSCAASRLGTGRQSHFLRHNRAMAQTPPGLESFLPLSPAVKRWAKLGRPSGAAFSSGIWGVIVVRGWRWTGGLPRAVFVPSRKRLQLADVAFRLRVVYHRGHGGTQRNPASNKWDGPSGWRGRIAHLRR